MCYGKDTDRSHLRIISVRVLVYIQDASSSGTRREKEW